MATEQEGYPALKEILEKLESLLAQDTLKLKDDKARKAAQSINEVLKQDSLGKLQFRVKEMARTRDELLILAKMDEIKRDLNAYQEQVNLLKARKTSIETHETVKENAHKEAVDKIANLKRSIERNILNSLNIKVQIS